VSVVTNLRDVVAELEAGRLDAVAIDIPIGLPARGPRAADVLARSRLGPRRSSVFPAPARAVLGATDYGEACARSRAACGKALSKQLFHILSKIQEADDAVTPGLQDRIAEMCPELSFAVMAGAPMAHAKSTPAGQRERRDALAGVFADAARHTDAPPRGARHDDVLDAFAGAWSARRLAAGSHLRLGGEADATGRRMEVIA
jgi:predicted RNase H-like nuclease